MYKRFVSTFFTLVIFVPLTLLASHSNGTASVLSRCVNATYVPYVEGVLSARNKDAVDSSMDSLRVFWGRTKGRKSSSLKGLTDIWVKYFIERDLFGQDGMGERCAVLADFLLRCCFDVRNDGCARDLLAKRCFVLPVKGSLWGYDFSAEKYCFGLIASDLDLRKTTLW